MLPILTGPKRAIPTPDHAELFPAFRTSGRFVRRLRPRLRRLKIRLPFFVRHGRFAIWISGTAPEEPARPFAPCHRLSTFRTFNNILCFGNFCRLRLLQKRIKKLFLFCKESIHRCAVTDRLQGVLPHSGRIGIQNVVGKDVAKLVRFFARNEMFFLKNEEAALLERFDDPRPRRFRSDALALLQKRLERFVLDVLVNFLHRLQERGRREARRRFCLPIQNISFHI